MANRFNFRVWGKKDNCFLEGLLLTRKGILKEVDFEEGTITTVNQTNYVLMQSTGLVDNNGKEVFEGDIIKYEDIIASVVYCKDKARFILEDNYNSIEDCDNENMKTYEIIGNIYENEELLNY